MFVHAAESESTNFAPGSATPQRLVDSRESGRDVGVGKEQESAREIEPKKTSHQILRHELNEAYDALHRPAFRLVVSGFSAGMELGFSLLLWSTIGNAIGGPVFVAMVKHAIAHPMRSEV